MDKFIEESENQNTKTKTVGNINILEKFLTIENETKELNIVLSEKRTELTINLLFCEIC